MHQLCQKVSIGVLFLATVVALAQTEPGHGLPAGLASDIPRLYSGEVPSFQDIGKRVAVGKLTRMDKTKLTISRPDGVQDSVVVDANTRFVSDSDQAITLAEFKIGDQVVATGTLKEGVFVAAEFGKVPPDFSTPPPFSPAATTASTRRNDGADQILIF